MSAAASTTTTTAAAPRSEGAASGLSAVAEEDTAPYTSLIVQLPPTVPELIQVLERQQERSAQMARCLERLRAESSRLLGAAQDGRYAALVAAVSAESSAAASTQTADVTPAASPPPPQLNTPASATTTPVRPTMLPDKTPAVVARGLVAASPVGAVSACSSAGGVVRGTVLTGKVVTGGTGTASSAATAVRAAAVVPSESAATPGKASAAQLTTAAAAAVSADEVADLRLRGMALEATQQLLAAAQDALSNAEHTGAETKARLEAALADLAALRREVLAAATPEEGSSTAESTPSTTTAAVAPAPAAKNAPQHLAELQTRLASREAALQASQQRRDAAVYALAQLQEKMSALGRDRAFLQEKNVHLEGQLQRLLMNSMEAAAGGPRMGGPAGGGAAASATPAPAPPRLSASEAYQKEALEKQINDLHALTDKLTRDGKKQAARRAKAEEVALALQKENAELKAAALQYRRQVNESELELERAISRREEEERLRQLERDANRLRSALRERTESFQKERAEWEQRLQGLRREATVHVAAEKQLLKRLLSYQVREAVWLQCSRRGPTAAGPPNGAHASGGHSRTSTAAATSGAGGGAGNGVRRASTDATVTPASAAAASLHAANNASSSSSSPASREATAAAQGSPATHTPVFGAAADTATLVDRERQLDELKHTFERRLALADAQRKAETQQLAALNKELRQALAVSQEELGQKSRLLDMAQRARPTSAAAAGAAPMNNASLGSSAGGGVQAVMSRRASSSSGWRDTATAWVCRTDGEDGPAASADDELDVSATHASTHTPIVAAPRLVTEIERRYDPERMSTWEAVQVENEALLDRLTTMQEEKWRLTSVIEDLQRQCGALKGELKRNASTMNQLLAAGVLTPAAVTRGSEEGRLRALQCLLQETLQAKFELEERLQVATRQLR